MGRLSLVCVLLVATLCGALPATVYGTLQPPDELAVSNSATNKKEVVDFTFRFVPQTTVPAGGFLDILFPSQFARGLGLGSTPVCSQPCSVFNWTVTVTFSTEVTAGVLFTLVVYSVTNPAAEGGTAFFHLQTRTGNNVLDMNKAFGAIGIESEVTAMTTGRVTISSSTSFRAGEVANYQFFFKPNRFLPRFNWLRFTFPANGYGLSRYPSCQAIAVNGKTLRGTLFCTGTGRQVQLTGFSEDIQAGTEVGVMVTATNPPQTGTTGYFWIETGRNLTNTVYERITTVPGVTITPGRITGTAFAQTDSNVVLSCNNLVLYTLKFTPYNPIEAGGSIRLQFNNNFNMPATAHYWVNYGLEDFSASQTVTVVYSTALQLLTVANFAHFTAREISLQLEIKNPGISGATPALVLTTYKADGLTVIDQDSTLSVTIVTTTSPVITHVLSSYLATGINVVLRFTFVPNLLIPALGYIRMYLPKGFIATATYPVCTMKPKNVSQASAPLCTIIDGLLTFQLFGNTAGTQPGTGDFQAQLDSFIDIAVGIAAPVESGYYVFNFLTYDQNFVLLESGTCGVTMTANTLVTYNFDSVHTEQQESTIIALQFTLLLPVPQGTLQPSLANQRGYLEVLFPTQDGAGNNLFATSLGFGVTAGSAIPCKEITGITAAQGYSLTCVLSTVPTTPGANSNVVVTVSNFAYLSAGVAIELHFSAITHVQTIVTNPTLTLTSYYIKNRLRTDLNTAQMALAHAPASTAASQSSVSTFSTTVTTVATSTTLTGSVLTVTALSGLNSNAFLVYIYSSHDNGYCAATTALVCKVDAVAYPCVCEPQADMILITIGNVGFGAGTTHALSIESIYNPGSVPVTNDRVKIYTISNWALLDRITYTTTTALPIQTAGLPAYASVVSSSTALGDINVHFTIKIQVGHVIASGGWVTILFPTGYSLHTSTPPATCAVSSLQALTAAGVGCSLFGVTVTVSSFQGLGVAGGLQAEIYGVKHPSAGTTSGPFTVATYNPAGLLIDYSASVQGVTFSTAPSVGSVTITGLQPFPLNARTNCEIAITFTLATPLPKGGQLRFTFPSAQFPQLPSEVSVRVTGGLTTLQSFSISGSTLIVVSDKTTSSGDITAYVMGLVNSDAGDTGSFLVTSVYDGVTMCQSGTNSIITIAPAASLFPLLSWTFYPRNEGEVATYSFTVQPTSDIPTDQVLIAVFPSDLDKRLGALVQCWAEGLAGVLSCTLARTNTLEITGFEKFLACETCQFTLNVYGVANPAAGSHGYISFGVMQGNSTYIALNSQIGPVVTVEAPGYNNLWEVNSTSLSCRASNAFHFNMTTSKSIPQSNFGGAVWLVFPSDYALGGASVRCTSSDYWAGGVPDCGLYYNTVMLNGQEFDYKGNLIVYLTGVPNPLYEVTASSITAKTYDGFNLKVLQSSYPNTNPSRFTFTYPGPLIVVNNDQPVQGYKGTMTSLVWVNLTYPCALNITLVPKLGDFCLVPYHVELYIGQIAASFRVALPQHLTSGRYYISWQLDGEIYPPFYTPVATTEIIVTVAPPLQVSFEAIPSIPRGGTSLPLKVWVPLPPDLNVTVTLSLPQGFTGLWLNQTTLEFSGGSEEQFYLMTADNNTKLASSVLAITLAGPNSSLYQLSVTSLSFSITVPTGVRPKLTSISSAELTRTTGSFRFSVSRPSMIYYQVALRGTPAPTFFSARIGGPALNPESQSQFGAVKVMNLGRVAVSGLSAGTKYTIYIWAENQELGSSGEVTAHDFATSPAYSAAVASMNFLQTFMTQDDIEKALNAVQLLLSLDQWRLLSNGAVPGTSGRRLALASCLLQFYILDDPSSDVYPTPKVLADLLGTKTGQLAAMLPALDATWTIAGNEVAMGQCRFQTTPTLSANATSIYGTVTLVEEGHIYAVCVGQESSQATPSTTQIASGQDASNSPVASFAQHIGAGTPTVLAFTGLLPSSPYRVYLTCGNMYPGRQQLLPDVSVIAASLQTAAKPAAVPIVLTCAFCVQLGLLLLLAVTS